MTKPITKLRKLAKEVNEMIEFATAYFNGTLPSEVVEAIAKEQEKGYAKTLSGALLIAKLNGWKVNK